MIDHFEEACFNLNLTKSELAKSLGISRGTYLNWHNSYNMPAWALFQMGFAIKLDGKFKLDAHLLDLFSLGDLLSKFLNRPKAEFPEIFERCESTIRKWNNENKWPLWALLQVEGLEIVWDHFEREI